VLALAAYIVIHAAGLAAGAMAGIQLLKHPLLEALADAIAGPRLVGLDVAFLALMRSICRS